MEDLGKLLIGLGVVSVISGGLVLLAGRVPLLGHLPGDIVVQRENFSCVVPLATSIVLSIGLTLVLNLLFRILNR